METTSKKVDSILKSISKLTDDERVQLYTDLVKNIPSSLLGAVKPAKTTKLPYDINNLEVRPYKEKSYIVLGAHRDMRPIFELLTFKDGGKMQPITINDERTYGWLISRTKYDRHDVSKIISDLKSAKDWHNSIHAIVSEIKKVSTSTRKTA